MKTKIVYNQGKLVLDSLLGEIINRVTKNRWEKINLGDPNTKFVFAHKIDPQKLTSESIGEIYTLHQIAVELAFEAGLPPNCYIWGESLTEELDNEGNSKNILFSLDYDPPTSLNIWAVKILEDAFAQFVEDSNKEISKDSEII